MPVLPLRPLEGSDPPQSTAPKWVVEALPAELRPLLIPLALHVGFVDTGHLEYMAKQADSRLGRADIDRLLTLLQNAGLLSVAENGTYALQPALTDLLRTGFPANPTDPAQKTWRQAFVIVMASIADALVPKEAHEQQAVFHRQGANFQAARDEAEALDMATDVAALTQALAVHAQGQRDFDRAARLYEAFVAQRRQHGDVRREASACHQLGAMALERRDLATAEHWYRQAMTIEEAGGDEHGAARSYHQLGLIAEDRRDFALAEHWYRRSAALEEKHGNEHGAAISYAQLGVLAWSQGHCLESGRWLVRAIEVFTRQWDPDYARQSLDNFMILYRQATPADQAELRNLWDAAGLGTLPGHGQAPAGKRRLKDRLLGSRAADGCLVSG